MISMLGRFDRRGGFEYKGHHLQVAPPEYVIVCKLEYFREGGSEKTPSRYSSDSDRFKGRAQPFGSDRMDQAMSS